MMGMGEHQVLREDGSGRELRVWVCISEEERGHPGWIPPVGRILSGANSALGQISPLISRLWQVYCLSFLFFQMFTVLTHS